MENTALQVVKGADASTYQLTPAQQVEKGAEMAKLLNKVVTQAGLAKSFGGKKQHLEYEAWQTIGQFFSATPVTEWTRPIKDGDEIVGWEAKVNIVNAEGRVIASAENMCMRDEPNWKSKPNYALRSMAQTRTAGKAFRSVFAFVAVLAGYSATPAEEMDESYGNQRQNPVSTPTRSQAPQNPAPQKKQYDKQSGKPKISNPEAPASQAQIKKIFAMGYKVQLHGDDIKGLMEWKQGDGEKLSMGAASELIDGLENDPDLMIKHYNESITTGPVQTEPDDVPY